MSVSEMSILPNDIGRLRCSFNLDVVLIEPNSEMSKVAVSFYYIVITRSPVNSFFTLKGHKD